MINADKYQFKLNNKDSRKVFFAKFTHCSCHVIHDCWYWYTITLLNFVPKTYAPICWFLDPHNLTSISWLPDFLCSFQKRLWRMGREYQWIHVLHVVCTVEGLVCIKPKFAMVLLIALLVPMNKFAPQREVCRRTYSLFDEKLGLHR